MFSLRTQFLSSQIPQINSLCYSKSQRSKTNFLLEIGVFLPQTIDLQNRILQQNCEHLGLQLSRLNKGEAKEQMDLFLKTQPPPCTPP